MVELCPLAGPLCLAASASAASWIEVSAPPPSECADTEVSTNVALNVNELEWADGTIVWDIPVVWELPSLIGNDYSKRLPVVYKQRFDFSPSGTLRVTKHGLWEERDADNTIRYSEGINTCEPFQ